MANKNLFGSLRGKLLPRPDARNHEGAPAYRLDARTALAQLAATGCFGNTFYVSAEEQLAVVLQNASECDVQFVAKVAVYARERGFMKDMPALLLAHLSTRGDAGIATMKQVFPRVIDNARMLRNFVQVLRSGQLGRKSLGTAPKKAVQRWLAGRSASQLFRDSIGNDPSLADVIKMVHPKPVSDEQKSMYGYLLGREHDTAKLPQEVRDYEAYKRGERDAAVPDVPFRMLDALGLGAAEWTQIATRASWQETRMNLNTYQRHGVFENPRMVELIAARLASAEQVRRAKVMPYQLLMAWKAAADAPAPIGAALQDAMEHAVANVPQLDGKVVICADVSGSMSSPVTGQRPGATTAVLCIDVAGLLSAAFLRRNAAARVLPFDTAVRDLRLNPRDSVMTLATQLAAIRGGGTSCSVPLERLNAERAEVDVVIFVSDNESWVDVHGPFAGRTTGMLHEWEKLRTRNPRAKLICIDLSPNTSKQVIDRADILNVGGFSDAVFDVAGQFAAGADAAHWAKLIDAVPL